MDDDAAKLVEDGMFEEAMEAEFAQIAQEEVGAGNDDPDLQEVRSYAKFINRRADEMAANKAFCERRNGILQREIDRAEGYRQWKASEALNRLLQGKKAKSIDTPSGRVGFRTTAKAKLEYDPHDEEALRGWCEQYCPDALSAPKPAQPRILKSVLGEFLAGSGAPTCDFVQIEPAGQTKFYYKPSKETPREGEANERE